MNSAEVRFAGWLKKAHAGAYIRKIPDFKQTASSLMRGLPDFMVMQASRTYWYEVKYTTKARLSLSSFTTAQMIEFKKMLNEGGVDVWVAIYDRGERLHLIAFSVVLEAVFRGEKSIPYL
jgi:Holliday junction resolvase